MHLIIDGYGADSQKLQDERLIHQFLDEYPTRIGMTKISQPFILRYVGVKPQDWGVSGFVLIAESHISIHTFPDRGYVNIDIFSCKLFDAERATHELQTMLGLSLAKTHLIERGLEYPTEMEAASKVVQGERDMLTATPRRRGGNGKR
ncbi:MAG: adenosylmethionine decarboxylase [Chloroflexi bacterium]|nr:adenosylmethionine decarboxylase [Chloroflexota bacterium]